MFVFIIVFIVVIKIFERYNMKEEKFVGIIVLEGNIYDGEGIVVRD